MGLGEIVRNKSRNDDSVNRGKSGVIILAVFTILLILFHSAARRENETAYGAPQINLPLPINSTKLLQYQPEKLAEGLDQKEFHGSDGCNFDSINGKDYYEEASITQGEIIGVGGWVADKVNKRTPQFAWIILADKDSRHQYQVLVSFWEKRPDVQEYFGGNKGYAFSGFVSNLKTDNLPIGKYHMYITFKGADIFYTCDVGRYLTINPKK
jgi:hypothetical protein